MDDRGLGYRQRVENECCSGQTAKEENFEGWLRGYLLALVCQCQAGPEVSRLGIGTPYHYEQLRAAAVKGMAETAASVIADEARRRIIVR